MQVKIKALTGMLKEARNTAHPTGFTSADAVIDFFEAKFISLCQEHFEDEFDTAKFKAEAVSGQRVNEVGIKKVLSMILGLKPTSATENYSQVIAFSTMFINENDHLIGLDAIWRVFSKKVSVYHHRFIPPIIKDLKINQY